MDQEEENKYVSQLQDVFNSCDTTGTGYLDKEELTELCHKLHLDAQLPLLLQTLLGNDLFARVNFEEFKEGFVAVLSNTIDISISEDESSYLEPVIPDEVKPKFVKGTKRYGRRTQPEFEAAENEANKYMQEAHNVKCKRKGQLRRSSSLESVESLKSDEEAESAREPHNENFEARGQLRVWDSAFFASPGRNGSLFYDMTEHQVRGIWEELGVGHNGYLNQEELATVCQNIGLKDLSKEKIEDLFKKLDQDGDGKVSFVEFQLGLFRYAPFPLSSTPLHQRRPWTFCQSLDDSSRRTATSSLLSSCGAIHLFSSIDDGTGFGNPEQIMVIWQEEGIEDCKNLLMSLDFNLEDRINLLDLTTALDSELIAAKNRFNLAALASYKHELQYHGQVNQITRERDKFKRDLERAEKRNLQLADEVDDHNSVMEQLNENKIKELEQEHRQRLSMIRTELEREKEQFLQNTDQQRSKLESDLSNHQIEESFLRDKLNLSIKENNRLQKEMVDIVGKLTESEKQVEKLQATVDHILKEKVRFDINLLIMDSELRDHNDELQIQMESLRSQLSESKYSRLLAKMKDNKLLHQKTKEKIHLTHGVPGKKGLSTRLRRSSSAAGVNGTVTVESEHSPMNMEVELTKHQLKEQQQEIQDLKIQLDTKVNYYEREVELMKSNFEKERRETVQSFKIEISELEEQKADIEELNTKYQEVIDGLKEQLQKSAHVKDLEKRFEKERAEMKQYYTKEISTLDKKLTGEKEQLEEELKRFHQQELQSMRSDMTYLLYGLQEMESVISSQRKQLQQETKDKEVLFKNQRDLEEEKSHFVNWLKSMVEDFLLVKTEGEKLPSQNRESSNSIRDDAPRSQDPLFLTAKMIFFNTLGLYFQNEMYQDELRHMNTQTLQLNGTMSDLSAQNLTQQETIQHLNSRLQEVTQRMEDEADATLKRHQETLSALEKEMERLEQELEVSKVENDKYQDELRQLNSLTLQLNSTVSNLSAQNMTQQETIQQLHSRLQEVTQHVEEADGAVTQFQAKLSTMEKENLEEISACRNERERFEQELQISKEKVQTAKTHTAYTMHIYIFLKNSLGLDSRLMQMSVMESNLNHVQEECQALRITEAQLTETLDESQDQLEEANAKLMLAASQHEREIQQLKEQISVSAPMDQLHHLRNRLLEEQQKVHQMREKLRFHAEQATKQLAMQQEAHEKLLRKMENRMESIEINLKNVRIMLQEKINQLKEQLEKNTKSDLLLKDLYVENAHLMKALQVTEERQKGAERRNYLLEEKIAALNKVLRKIAPASLAV
uniref:Ninein-like protein n=1 Tax=Leptobrachium leishanense TaxID=445787 RepID=A0A8C5MWM6_9ANUR